MPQQVLVTVVFTCDNLAHHSPGVGPHPIDAIPTLTIQKSVPTLSNGYLASESGVRWECAQEAKSQGWRITEISYICLGKVLCPSCNQSFICEHGYDQSWPEHKKCNGR